MRARDLHPDAQRMLFADWFTLLASDNGKPLRGRSGGSESFTLGPHDGFHVVARFVPHPTLLTFEASDPAEQDWVNSVVSDARRHVAECTLGDSIWYSGVLHDADLEFSGRSFVGPLIQRISMQTRIVGWRRLGRDVLVEFVEVEPENPDPNQRLLVPKTQVHVHMAVPAPCDGFFGSHVAHGILEVIGAIVTFALGRLVNLPPAVFATKLGDQSILRERRLDPEVRTLARKGVSLDILTPVTMPGGFEVFTRASRAFMSFEAALEQKRDPVACVLYVVAAESLTTPKTHWRRTKLTARFLRFFEDLMPDELDAIVAHANFEDAFRIRRGTRSSGALRRALLNHIYDFRSGNLHEGVVASYRAFSAVPDSWQEVRRGLFADFAEGAILRFLCSPRSSLIGHPDLATASASDPS